MTRTVAMKFWVAVLGVVPLWAAADGIAGYTAQSIIDGNTGHNVQGVTGVNMASGDSNLQNNAAAVGVGNGPATAQANVVQAITSGRFSVPNVAVSRIDGAAFTNASGVIAINQAAGAANAQANSVAIAIGVGAEVTADAELAQTVSGVTGVTVAGEGQYRETSMADTAFNGARGIVQVNQSAGIGNATGNSFTLRVQLGAVQ